MLTKSEIVPILKSYHLGLRRKTVKLIPYAPSWNKAFEYISGLIRGCSSRANKWDFQHIGSTSLPGGVAKPILDVGIAFDDPKEFEAILPDLEKIGFTYKGEYGLPGRYFFSYYDADYLVDFVHLHAFKSGHSNLTEMVEFRDRLLSNPDKFKAYMDMKLGLKSKNTPRKDYTFSKGPFVKQVLSGM